MAKAKKESTPIEIKPKQELIDTPENAMLKLVGLIWEKAKGVKENKISVQQIIGEKYFFNHTKNSIIWRLNAELLKKEHIDVLKSFIEKLEVLQPIQTP